MCIYVYLFVYFYIYTCIYIYNVYASIFIRLYICMRMYIYIYVIQNIKDGLQSHAGLVYTPHLDGKNVAWKCKTWRKAELV